VVARYLEALDNLVAERVEAMLDASLIHYHNNQVYQALRYVRAASAFVKEVLSMIRSEEFSNFIMAADSSSYLPRDFGELIVRGRRGLKD